MTWNDDMRQFIASHLSDDTTRLLLSAHRYPGIDMPFAVEQIEARRRLRTKLPEWYAIDNLIMSGRVPAEQCSSEQTARFKREVMLQDAQSLCDMTGGMGVDFWYMSRGLQRTIYTERQPALCEAARHNFAVLSAAALGKASDVDSSDAKVDAHTEIIVREGLSTSLPVPDVDVIYLDPARRSTDGSRIYEISDCEPDVVAWQDELLAHCRQLITKVSPMADISRSVSRLRNVTDVYVLSVRNECKEVLIVQQSTFSASSTGYQLHCVDFLSSHLVEFHIAGQELRQAPLPMLASAVGQYLYEPDVSVMKCQPFGVLSDRYELAMFDTDCHYFTSEVLASDFPGRVFVVDEVMEFSSKLLKRLRSQVPQANISTRGFPVTADQLRSRTGIRDGGDVYLFGATLHDHGPLLLRCHKQDLSRPSRKGG